MHSAAYDHFDGFKTTGLPAVNDGLQSYISIVYSIESGPLCFFYLSWLSFLIPTYFFFAIEKAFSFKSTLPLDRLKKMDVKHRLLVCFFISHFLVLVNGKMVSESCERHFNSSRHKLTSCEPVYNLEKCLQPKASCLLHSCLGLCDYDEQIGIDSKTI